MSHEILLHVLGEGMKYRWKDRWKIRGCRKTYLVNGHEIFMCPWDSLCCHSSMFPAQMNTTLFYLTDAVKNSSCFINTGCSLWQHRILSSTHITQRKLSYLITGVHVRNLYNILLHHNCKNPAYIHCSCTPKKCLRHLNQTRNYKTKPTRHCYSVNS